MKKQLNPGEYNKKIQIVSITSTKDADGFNKKSEEITEVILDTWAKVKTTKGYTLIQNSTDFEKAYTNFTIRYPKKEINRKMFLKYNNSVYTIEYLNNIDEEYIELEIQAKVVKK